MTSAPPDKPDPPPDHGDTAPPPRAFSQGTGVLLQTVGMVLFLSSCCVCSTAGLWDPVASRADVINQLQEAPDSGITLRTLLDDPAKAGIMLTVMFTTIGGLMMAVLGLGLQAGKIRAAWAAVVGHGLMLLILIGAGIAMWVGRAPFGFIAWNAILLLTLIAILGFCVAALADVRRNPAPADDQPLANDLLIDYNVRGGKLPELPTPDDIAQHRAWLREQAEKLDRLEQYFYPTGETPTDKLHPPSEPSRD